MTGHLGVCWDAIAVLRNSLLGIVERELRVAYADEWWAKGVAPRFDKKRQEQLKNLFESRRKNVLAPHKGGEEEMLDITDLHKIVEGEWGKVFKAVFPKSPLHWLQEVIDVRNPLAHPTRDGIPAETVRRLLDNCRLILEPVDPKAAEEIAGLIRSIETAPGRPSLRPWREVAVPHKDVSGGKLKQSEFAADLAQVVSGRAGVEYHDAEQFFARSYLTEGLSQLLVEAAERITGKGGEPVIELKTAFGGGKTHTMIALFHFFGGKAKAADLEGAAAVLAKAGLSELPKARPVVLVGTALDATKPRKVKGLKGEVRTLWGEIAVQLGGAEAYEAVRRADEAGVSPGSDTLVEIIDRYGPAVILVDELVAYARNIYGKDDLPSGTFDSVMSFVQSLTEAVKRSQRSVLVASLPSSDIEMGGPGGAAALERIQHTFGRLKAIWKPVGTHEAFEVVRRRLFQSVDARARDETCRAYAEMYREAGVGDFPAECREGTYLDRLKAAYPIHPEVFERLYGDWATLDLFQRTRGVLRLMAASIHRLWVDGDRSPMILPGSLPLYSHKPREELTRYLSEGWTPVVETDVDGEDAEPRRLDQENHRFGAVEAGRRVARTLFLGSAPSVPQQTVRGIEDIRIRLGSTHPGDSVAVFNDALSRLSNRLTHLYSDERKQRYWLDTKPNLTRTVSDRAQTRKPEEIAAEIDERLRAVRADREKHGFRRIHAGVPAEDIPDEEEARLVVLPLDNGHRAGRTDSAAIRAAGALLDKRQGGPRSCRNMLVFLAPDAAEVQAVEDAARLYLAWKSVHEEADLLNLDTHQRKMADDRSAAAEKTLSDRLQEAYSWLLVPVQEGTGPITWDETQVRGSDPYAGRVADRLRKSAHLYARWNPAELKMELDRWFWNDAPHVPIKKVWGDMTKYCYLPRLTDQEVFLAAVRDGLRSRDYFAYATSVGPDGRYLGLAFGAAGAEVYVDDASVLVKPDAAAAQTAADEAKRREEGAAAGPGAPPAPGGPTTTDAGPARPPDAVPAQPTRFHGSVRLDANRVGRDAGRIAEEIVQHLAGLPGAEVDVTLEIHARAPKGVPEKTVRTVAENSRALKVQGGFEGE